MVRFVKKKKMTSYCLHVCVKPPVFGWRMKFKLLRTDENKVRATCGEKRFDHRFKSKARKKFCQ